MLHYFSDVKYKNEAVLAEAFRLTVNSLLHDKEPPVKVQQTVMEEIRSREGSLNLKFVLLRGVMHSAESKLSNFLIAYFGEKRKKIQKTVAKGWFES